MSGPWLRLCSTALILAVPMDLAASDVKAAMLYAEGSVFLNQDQVPSSGVAFEGDSLSTTRDSAARLVMKGSAIDIEPQSSIKFEGSSVELEMGRIIVATSGQMRARTGNIVVAPPSTGWCKFQVSRDAERLEIVAEKGNLTIIDGTTTTPLAEGHSASYFASRKKGASTIPTANGGILDSPVLIGTGTAVIVGVTVWALSKGNNEFSPSIP